MEVIMDLIQFLANSPHFGFLGLAGILLVSVAMLLGRSPTPIRIPVRRERRRRLPR
jgi:hypothetical protein